MTEVLPGSVDVFVVGGGPAGLATAIAARRRGLSVLVADGVKPPVDKACGEGIMPDGVEALRALGVTFSPQDVRPFRGIRFVNGEQAAEAVFPHGTAYGVRRTALHTTLLRHAAESGVQLRWQTPVIGINSSGVFLRDGFVSSRWIVGADGAASRVRRWMRVGPVRRSRLRFAARQHYHVSPWTDFMELHWGRSKQIYVTAVGPEEICVAAVSDDPMRLRDALEDFPVLQARLADAEFTSPERGGVTANRGLQRLYRDNVALVGDASAGVDAITGEGLCLAFQQSSVLADCLAAGDLSRYEIEHRRIVRRPTLMARLMLLMGDHDRLRQRTMRVFESSPRSFARMLAMHVGAGSAGEYFSNGISLGWHLLKA